MLLFGPLGTGKAAWCRVLAPELGGQLAVVLCDSRAIGGQVATAGCTRFSQPWTA